MDLFRGAPKPEIVLAKMLYESRGNADIKNLINLGKQIDDVFGTKVESEFRNGIRDMVSDTSKYEFDCKEAGFHIWDFNNPSITIDKLDELEVTFECVQCETKVVLRGTTEPSKGD